MRYYSAYVYSDEEVEKQNFNDKYVQVNCAGCYAFDRTYHSITHRKSGRNDYMLVYTHTGRSLARFYNNENIVNAGSVFIYKPGEEQYYGQVKNEPLCCYWVHFTGYGIPEIFRQLDLERRSIIQIGVSDSLVIMFDMMIKEIIQKQYNYEIILSAMLLQLLHYISSKAYHQDNSNHSGKNNELINMSINYINMNYYKNITVKELAGISGLCVSRYINVFRENIGFTPKEYMIKVRLDKACEMLYNTNLSIKEIALLTGFEDQLYFSRVFKKYKKVSPTEYRKTQLISSREKYS